MVKPTFFQKVLGRPSQRYVSLSAPHDSGHMQDTDAYRETPEEALPVSAPHIPLHILHSLASARPQTPGRHRRALLHPRLVSLSLLTKLPLHDSPFICRLFRTVPHRRRPPLSLPSRPRVPQYDSQARPQAYVHRRGLGKGRPLACRTSCRR